FLVYDIQCHCLIVAIVCVVSPSRLCLSVLTTVGGIVVRARTEHTRNADDLSGHIHGVLKYRAIAAVRGLVPTHGKRHSARRFVRPAGSASNTLHSSTPQPSYSNKARQR